MYYKVIFNERVIDVLDCLTYLKWDERLKCMVLTSKSFAQAILSSNGNTIWHAANLLKLPVQGYDTVDLVKIDEYEYKQLKALNMSTPEEIIDEFVLSLLKDNLI